MAYKFLLTFVKAFCIECWLLASFLCVTFFEYIWRNIFVTVIKRLRWRLTYYLYTVSQKKQPKLFRQNFVKFPLTLIIFGMKMAKTIELCKVHSFSTSPNLCHQHAENADVPNCYTTLWLLVRERSALSDPYCQSTWMSVCGWVCLSATLRSNIWETKGAIG